MGKMICMDLVTVLQRLYDSEINVTITTLWDGGYDFALISYMGGVAKLQPDVKRS